jgi:predicted DCC family thiol-disulfide oxidoreductase YuxK
LQKVILFDGVCNLCNHSVQFIIKRDKEGKFQFTSLQGEAGLRLREKYKLNDKIDSIVLIENNRYFTESTAALKIAKHLDGFWKCLYILWIVPRPIRNFIYRYIAKNRYKWFGKNDACMLPTKEIKERFLD